MTDIGEIVKRQVRGGDVTRLLIESVSWVYILTNESMPGLVKIGVTTGSVQERARALSGVTGVPTPFQIYYAMKCTCGADVEKRIHKTLDECRVNPGREFFRMAPEDARTSLWMADIEVSNLIDEEHHETAMRAAPNRHFIDFIGGEEGMIWHA
jgi:hypothetical protein